MPDYEDPRADCAPQRLLYIARFRSLAMERKIELMAGSSDLQITLVRPSLWRDRYGTTELPIRRGLPYDTYAVNLVGRHTDPHRVLYRTLSFGVRKASPDIIHAEAEPDSLAALQICYIKRLLASRAKLILHTWQNVDRRKAWYVRAVIHATLSQADAVLCANPEGTDILRNLGYSGTTAVVLQEGIDIPEYQPVDHKYRRIFTIGFVGRLEPEKGVSDLIRAFSMVPRPSSLRLVGEGSGRSALEALVKQLGLESHVVFRGAVASDRIGEEYRRIDLLVLPSRTTPVWKEQFGRVLVEAMATGVAVIGSDSGAIPSVIGEAGIVVPEGDIEALARAIQTIAGSAVLCNDLKRKGRKRAHDFFTQERVARQTVSFYRTLASGMAGRKK